MVERLGIEVAAQQASNAAIVLVCGETLESLTTAMTNVRHLTRAPLIAVGTKSDTDKLASTDVSALRTQHGASMDDIDYVAVSAQTGDGLSELVQKIAEILDRDRAPLSGDSPILTRERHRMALVNARSEMAQFLEIWNNSSHLPATIAAVHLQSARAHLEELVGVLDVDEVLDRVFSSFCIGK